MPAYGRRVRWEGNAGSFAGGPGRACIAANGIPCPHPLQSRPGHALAGLEDDIADKAITNHHIHPALEEVVAFDIADEINVEMLAELECLKGQFVAFAFFGAVAEDSDAGIFVSKNLARVDATHG